MSSTDSSADLLRTTQLSFTFAQLPAERQDLAQLLELHPGARTIAS